MTFLRTWCLVISVLVIGGVTQKRCPPQEIILPCRCLLKGEEIQIWCSHSDLPNVLEGLRAIGQFISEPIDELILESNYLPSLPGRTFVPLKVMRLMLRYNGLERVSSDWLVGLEQSLMELFVVEPDLRSLPDDSLMHLNRLEAITIQTNLMKRFPLFSGLPKLRFLQLESLSLLELSSRNFKNLPLLETIHISNSPRLSRLEGNFLQDLPTLKLVNISYCGLNWMHPRAITRLPKLKELSFVGNKIVDAGMVARGARDLPQLETLRLDHNYIEKISEATFVDLPSLRRLFLSNNHITELEYGAFHQVPMLRSLDLNQNSVRRVHPESFLQHSGSGLEELWLINNDIGHVAELRSLLDALPRLTFLELSHNNLEAIPFGALRGHPTLERLHLDFNKIHLIDREAFMAMPALRELRLKNNSLSDILEGPFWNLPALKGLDLSGNFFRRLEPRLLENLPSLRRVDLSENELSVVDPTTFLGTPALEHVNLSRNALSMLHPATFRHLLSLYELDVSHNYLVEFVPGLPRGIEYLHMSHNRISAIPASPSPDLDLPSLRMLDISDNEIQRIPSNSLQPLLQLRRFYIGGNLLQRLDENSLGGLSRLEVLDLQHNKVLQIHPNSLREMMELRELNLRNNRMDILFPEIFRNVPRLKRLDISRNQLAEILPGTLEKIREIQIIDASHNFLVQLPPNLSGMKKLKKLDLTDNRLKDLHPETLSSLTALTELKVARNFIHELKKGAFDNLHHLRVLHLESNELEVVEPNAIRSLPVLKSLRINNNKLREIPNFAFNNLPSLQVAELQQNEIKIIGNSAFHLVPHLVLLNLSHNHLTGLEDAGLRSLKSLEMLDVSNNKISRVTTSNLDKMEWLVELKMNDNSICAIHGSPFNGMPRLRVLSLRNNKMMSLPEQAVQQVRSNIAVLDIDGNPLVCSCNLLWLQSWLQEGSSMGPRCVDGTLLRELRLSRQDCPVEERNVELVAPGCEAELLTAPGAFGTSQVFSPWMNLKTNLSKSENQNHLAPSPEESEYFYDEYVDYPYNNDTAQQVDGTNSSVPTVTTSPHVIPGDTPTLYAASKNQTKPDIPKEVSNSPSTSGFTFFGVPLPSLSLNKLWGGNGRKEDKKTVVVPQVADRKTAIVNKPPRTGGRGGTVPEILNMRPPPFAHGFNLEPPPQIGRFNTRPPPQLINTDAFPQMTSFNTGPPPRHGFNIGPLSPRPQSGFNVGPPDSPEVEMGGFIPLLPGTGGFKPIPNPSLQQPEASNLTEVTSTDASTVLPQIVLRNKTEFVNIDHPILPSPPPPTTSGSPPATTLPQNQNVTVLLQFQEEVTEATAKIEEFTENPEVDTGKFEDIFQEVVDNVSIPTTTETKIETTLADVAEIETIASETFEVDSATQKEEAKRIVGTPLSALLVPGGQQPEYRPSGRPTITKVPSPHISGSEPLVSNMDIAQISDPLPHNREGKTTKDYGNADEGIEVASDDTSWYFANYNKTNLEPYIGVDDTVTAGEGGLERVGISHVLSVVVLNFIINGAFIL